MSDHDQCIIAGCDCTCDGCTPANCCPRCGAEIDGAPIDGGVTDPYESPSYACMT